MPDPGLHSESTIETARRRVEEKMEGMSFFAHLDELRKRIIRSLMAVAVGFVACFSYADRIFAWVQKPIMVALRHNGLEQKLVYLNPTEPFNMYIKVGIIAGLFLTSPIVLYQVWSFVAPGLYRHEKRYAIPFLVSTVVLFCAGGYAGYSVVYPAALEFLVHYGRQFQPMITIGEYTDLFLMITVGMGVIFEMPILAGFLSAMGVVSAKFLWKNLRYAILVCFVIAAIVTPADVMSMCLFAAPMVALYLASTLVAWVMHPKQRKARAAKRQG